MSNWTTVQPLPNGQRGAEGATGDGKLWIFGGTDGSFSGFAPYRQYDPETDSWTSYGAFLGLNFTAGVWLDGWIYTFGGFDAGESNYVQRYDPYTDTAEQLKDFPHLVESATAETDGTYIYIIGGVNDGTPYSDPILAWDIPYKSFGFSDAAVFDTYNRGETDSDGNFAWQQVHSPAHEFVEYPTVDNSLARARFNETGNTIAFEEWSSGSWSIILTGSSSWEFREFTLKGAGPLATTFQVYFEDANSSSSFTLNGRLNAGYDRLQWTLPETVSGPIPSGLEDLLAPITTSSYKYPNATFRARDRTVVEA